MSGKPQFDDAAVGRVSYVGNSIIKLEVAKDAQRLLRPATQPTT